MQKKKAKKAPVGRPTTKEISQSVEKQNRYQKATRVVEPINRRHDEGLPSSLRGKIKTKRKKHPSKQKLKNEAVVRRRRKTLLIKEELAK